MIDYIDSIIARFKKEMGEEIEIHLSYFLTRLKPVESGYLTPSAAAQQIMTHDDHFRNQE